MSFCIYGLELLMRSDVKMELGVCVAEWLMG